MSAWIISAACCAVVVSVLQQLLPKGGMKKIGMLAGGALLLLTVLQPLTALDADLLSIYTEKLNIQQTVSEEELSKGSKSLLEKLIAEESRAYILEWADEIGISCEAEVWCETDEHGIPLPAGVTVTSNAGEEKLRLLAERIESELGISKEYQIYREEQ